MDEKQAEIEYGKPDSFVIPYSESKCSHYFVRKNASEVKCDKCPSIWIDSGKFILENGKILGRK